jgi:hypothetical protein
MAMLSPTSKFFDNGLTCDDPTQTYDTPICGKLLMSQLVVREYDTIDPKSIKEELAHRLAGRMLELGLVEFTKLEDARTGNTTYRSRCYVAESGDVKVLRTAIQR